MKTALITGASRGIGRAIARALASEQYRLYLHGRDRQALQETSDLVARSGGETVTIVADLARPEEVSRLAEESGDGSLDVLINNAGVAAVNPLDKMTLDEWQRMLAINVTAPFLLIQKLLPRMKQGAAIVNILSVAAQNGFAGWSGYCASKFALDGFTKSIREELRSGGIRVINVYPGATATDIWNNLPGDWPKEKMLRPEEIAEAVMFALNRPDSVLVEEIKLGGIAGKL